ncbi:MAG: hypothetical protein E7329_11755 [Clostridiales bacterium]|nr:hypothetical protein [Clostridiales bacterium]
MGNLLLGIPMMLGIFIGCQALLDIVEFVGIEWLKLEAAHTVLFALKWVTLLSFPGVLLIWWLFGERLIQRIKNWGWLVGLYVSVPINAVVRFSAGFLQDLNRARGWMEEDLLFRLCRMTGNCILPLGALIGFFWWAMARRGKKDKAGSEAKKR